MRFLSFSFALFLTTMAMAQEEAILQKVQTEKEKLLKKEEQKRNILADLYTVTKDLKKINAEKSKLENKLKRTNENIEGLQHLIDQLDLRVNAQKSKLRSRIKALSKFHGQGLTRLIFSSQNSTQLDMNLRVYRIITERDYRLMKAFGDSLRVSKIQKSKLDNEQKRYATLKKNLSEKEGRLATQMDKKNDVLKNIDSSRLLHMARLRKLRAQGLSAEAKEKEMAKISAMENLLKAQFFERKGAMQPPVRGRVSVGFGLIEDHETQTKMRNKGVLIETRPGEKIKSIHDGRIVFADEIAGFGQTIIIDHGDHYFSVYANADNIKVSEGEYVEEGSELGETSMLSTYLGHGLYFELRHFSDSENPIEWLQPGDS